MNIKSTLTAVIAASCFTIVNQASAVTVASDDFDYTLGSNLNTQNGGTGWEAGWTAVTSVTVQSLGGSKAARFTGNNDELAVRQMDTAFGDEAGEDLIYVSYDITVGVTPVTDFFILWLDDTGTGGGHGDANLNMGLYHTNNAFFARIELATPVQGDPVTVASAGTTYQLVAEYSKSTPGASNRFDTLRFWIDPGVGDINNPIGSDTSLSGTSLQNFDYVGFRGAANEGGDEFYVQNLTLATTWSEVVIPEPGTYALLTGLGVLALCALTRRQKKVN